MVVIRPDGLLDFEYLATTIAACGVTHLDPVPSLMTAVAEYVAAAGAWRQLDSLRCIMLGGEAPPSALVSLLLTELPLVRVFNTYGPAECSIVSTLWECRRGRDGESAAAIPIGRPLRRYACAVLDAWQRPVPLHGVGELYIGGAGVFAGYLGRPDLTARAVVDASRVHAGLKRAYRTGDLVRQLSCGALVFAGRIDSQVRR